MATGTDPRETIVDFIRRRAMGRTHAPNLGPGMMSSGDPYFDAVYGGIKSQDYDYMTLGTPLQRGGPRTGVAVLGSDGEPAGVRTGQIEGPAAPALPQGVPGAQGLRAPQRGDAASQLVDRLMGQVPDEMGFTRNLTPGGIEQITGNRKLTLGHAKALIDALGVQSDNQKNALLAEKQRFEMSAFPAAMRMYGDLVQSSVPAPQAWAHVQKMMPTLERMAAQARGEMPTTFANTAETEGGDEVANQQTMTTQLGIQPGASPEQVGAGLLQQLGTPGAVDKDTIAAARNYLQAQKQINPWAFSRMWPEGSAHAQTEPAELRLVRELLGDKKHSEKTLREAVRDQADGRKRNWVNTKINDFVRMFGI